MRVLCLCLWLSASLGAAAPVLAGDAAAGQAKAGICRTCHGLDGIGTMPGFPHLAGQNEFYLNQQLHNFKKGTRQSEQMAVIVQALSEEDMANLAAYYAGLKPACD